MKTKSPQSLVTGLMWFTQFSKERPLPIRHTCEQGDHLPRYGWLMHNGKDFGVQEIVDKNFTLTTEFVKRPGGKHGGDWTARFSGKPKVGLSYTHKQTSAKGHVLTLPNFPRLCWLSAILWLVQGSSCPDGPAEKQHTLIAAHDCALFSVRLLIALNMLSWM